MSAEDVELARRFLATLEAAAQTGSREAVYAFLAPEIEWVTPKRTLRGIDAVKEQLTWGAPPENLDLEFDPGNWEELGDGHLACRVHQTYRMKTTGEFAYERERRVDVWVREGAISRYEMRSTG
jgi:hypothetical protein